MWSQERQQVLQYNLIHRILIMNDVIKSQLVSLSGKGNDCYPTSINLHMICSTPILHRVYI